MKRVYLLTIGILLLCHIHADAGDTISLEVINTSHIDYVKYSKINKFSVFPAFPYKDSIARFPNLLGEEYEFFDYKFRITYGRELVKKAPNQIWAWVRFYINKQGKVKFAVDANMDEVLESKEIKDFKNDRDTIRIQTGQINIDYELSIPNKRAISSSVLGSVNVKPITLFRGKFKSGSDYTELIVVDNILGVRIFMDSMFMDDKILENVKLNQEFYYKSDARYFFTDCDIFNTTLYFEQGSRSDRSEGVDVGYYVNMTELSKHLKTDIKKQKVVLYFWGIWCKPCLDNFPKTLEINTFARGKKNIEMFFCSYNIDQKDVANSDSYIEGMVDKNRRIHELSSECMDVLSDDYIVKYNTLITMLKVSSFPLYIVLREDGKILYRDSKVTKQLFELIED